MKAVAALYETMSEDEFEELLAELFRGRTVMASPADARSAARRARRLQRRSRCSS